MALVLSCLIAFGLGACEQGRFTSGIPESGTPGIDVIGENGLVNLGSGNLRLVIDSLQGGRIIEFSRNGRNILHDSGEMVGSTFWTSPQQDWFWPPPAAIDSGPYAVEIYSDKIRLISEFEPDLGIRVEKTLRPVSQPQGFEIVYSIRNLSAKTVRFAPWEVTRLPRGLVFYPSSGYSVRQDFETIRRRGVTWFRFPPGRFENSVAVEGKVMEDGLEGWVAVADAETGLLFVKSFPDIDKKQFAPVEAEIELYSSPDGEYMEVEQQGAFQAIAPMTAVDWQVNWYLEAPGPQIDLNSYSDKLVDWVRALLESG